MFPLKDDIPTRRFPILTVILIALNVGFFIWQTQAPIDEELEQAGVSSSIDASAIELGAIPYRITHPSQSDCFLAYIPDGKQSVSREIVCQGQPDLAEAERIVGKPLEAKDGTTSPIPEPEPLSQAAWWITLLTSMFMHGGIIHIAGNLLFLWIFGNNIEDSMGRPRFLLFYVLAGLAAVYGQSLLDPSSTVPTIGASGAVAGVLGGYALLYPRARVLTFIFIIFFVTLIEVPAAIILGIWFVLQFLPAIGQTAVSDIGTGGEVAYMAHVAGFAFGLAAIKLFANRRNPAAGAQLASGP